MSTKRPLSILLAIPFIAMLTANAALSDSPEEDLIHAHDSMRKIGPVLARMYESSKTMQAQRSLHAPWRGALATQTTDTVGVDLYATDEVTLKRDLAAIGASKVKNRGPLFTARIPVTQLGALAGLASLRFATPAMAKLHRAPSQGRVVSQGDHALHSDFVRKATGLSGSGVTVGVLSDSYECNPESYVPGAPNSTAQEDEASQDVPPNVRVLDNGPCPGTDEGRAMVQLVHDVAPGAAQQFYTAYNSLVDFAFGILELRAAGSDIIVDDVGYFAENMFSDGIIAQAADLAVKDGAAYFSAAGNQARLSYEQSYREVALPIKGNGKKKGSTLYVHDFEPGSGVDTKQKLQVTPSGGLADVVFSFQWDQPFLSSTTFADLTDPTSTSRPRGATGDLDLLFYDSKGNLVPICPDGDLTGLTCQVGGTRNVGDDAVDLTELIVQQETDDPVVFYARIVHVEGQAPKHIKYVAYEFAGTLDIVEHDTRSGTAYGHPNAQNVAAVGASAWYLTDTFDRYFSDLVDDRRGQCLPACLNDFSSAGGVPIYLNKYGERLRDPDMRQTPRFTAPDGGNTTFFLADSSYDDDDHDGCNSPTSTFITPCLDDPADEWPNFFGTSAAAPHAAAVAALMLDKNRQLRPGQIYRILSATAKDIRKREVEVVPGPGNSSFSPLPFGYDFDSGHGFVDAARAILFTPRR